MIMLTLFVHMCDAICDAANRVYSVNTWSGSWEFTGFDVSAINNDYYHLLSTSDGNQCAIVKETAAEALAWAKVYSVDQCQGISVDQDESFVYFVNKGASYIGINKINASTGESSNYYTSNAYNSSLGINTIYAGGFGGNVMFGGNVDSSSPGISCGFSWNTSSGVLDSICSDLYKTSAFFAGGSPY